MNSSSAVLDEPISDFAETRPKSSGRPVLAFLLNGITILIVLLYALPILTLPPGRDQGTYLEIGQSLIEGKRLYLDLWDNKPPGIFALYAGIARVFGKVLWSTAVVDVLLLLVISYLLFGFARRYIGQLGAVVAVITNAAWFCDMKYWAIAQPETFQVLFAFLAYNVISEEGRRWKLMWVFTGLLSGFGFWQKYNFLGFLPLFLILPFLDLDSLSQTPPRLAFSVSFGEWSERAAFLVSGFAFVGIAVSAWIVSSGGWPAMREGQFEVLPRYAAMAIQRNPHYISSAFIRTYYFLGPANLFAALATLIIGWASRDLKRVLPVFLAAATAFASTIMQMRFHDYYFQICDPFFALLWGYLAVKLYELTRTITTVLKRDDRRLAATLVWVLTANIYFWPIPEQISYLSVRYAQFQRWREDRRTFYANYPGQLPWELLKGQLEVVDYIEKNSSPNDPIYLWGSNSLIYFLTNRPSPTRFVLNLGVMAEWGKPEWKQEVLESVKKIQPSLIIITRSDAVPMITYVNMDSEEYLREKFSSLRSYIDHNYTRVAEFDGFLVYKKTSQWSPSRINQSHSLLQTKPNEPS
jgi:hypothetical protein